jgi:Tol biopolymer transport system component
VRARAALGTLLAAAAAAGAAACADLSSPAPRVPAGSAADGLLLESRVDGPPSVILFEAGATRGRALALPGGMMAKDPAPSPDGTRVAFVSRREGERDDVWVVNADGTGLRRLTTDPARDDQPAWSPDGRRIAFRSLRAGRLGDVWVMDADGARQTNLTPDAPGLAVGERDPAWSPDGSRLAYSSGARPCTASEEEIDADWGLARGCVGWGIWTMAADGADQRRLAVYVEEAQVPGYQGMPAWSPDGRTVVFSMTALGGQNLVFVPAAGGQAVEAVLPGGQGMAAWTPAGDAVVFVHQDSPGRGSGVYVLRLGGGGLPQVLVDRAADNGVLNPAFLPHR